MKKKRLFSLILISSALVFALAGTSSAEHPALAIMKRYTDNLKDTAHVNPYFVSILALKDVEQGRHAGEVRRFILWYFSRLNYPDHHGLTGTIYDYVLENGRERSTSAYDSVDGYAGIFLHLLHQYARRTGDLDIIRVNWKKIEDIAYLISFLQDKNGLTRALPDRKEQYLMDNCEAYAGMEASIKLRKLLRKPASAYHNRVRSAIKKTVLARLYEPESRVFSWAMLDNQTSRTDWTRFYPDAYAQLFPVYFGLLEDNPKLKQHLWREFTRRYAAQTANLPLEQRTIYEVTRQSMEGRFQP